ncbi:uncharacterized protein LOC108410688 [Pygocentrus nattereri]|uniref:uncharacterized protein LOC108410688 n=1 Tax=Pygocentrus nattereri TaxID=42514 RepID=UPI000814B139|nr:uncharacterized protein LOC108410688 [Pygocentrus nattereri]
MMRRNSQTALAVLLALLSGLGVASDHVNGTVGENLNLTFEFSHGDSISAEQKFNVYRNEMKIGHFPNTVNLCNSSAVGPKQNLCVTKPPARKTTLLFTNLTVNDSGVYHLTVFAENQIQLIISSTRVNLTVHPGLSVTTVSAPTSSTNNNSSSIKSQPEMISRYLIFSTLVFTPVLLLAGLLVWFCRTYRRKSDDTPDLNAHAAQQGTCPVSTSMPSVSCVEYGVLDFQSRPNRPERHSNPEAADGGVEYAAIMFPPQKKRT